MKPALLASYAVILGLFAAPHIAAEELAPEPKAPAGPPTLQLKHILVPVQSTPGGFTTSLRPLTPILVVPRDFNAPLVCQRAPRVAEALLNYFMKNPAPVDRSRRLDAEAMDQQKRALAAYVNRAIGLNAVSEVYIIEGGKSLSTGVAARLPFAHATGCGPVLEAYEKRVQEFLKE